MRYRLLIAFLMFSILQSGALAAKVIPPLTTADQAKQLAKNASDGVSLALEHARNSLEVLLAEASSSTKLKLQVFRDGPSFAIHPLRAPEAASDDKLAIIVDELISAQLQRHGRLIRFYMRPEPHFLVAVETKTQPRRAAGLEVPLKSLVQALASVPLPSGTRLEILSKSGDLLSHQEWPLTPEEQTASKAFAGHGLKSEVLANSTIAYSPIGQGGAGILVVVPAPGSSLPPLALASPSASGEVSPVAVSSPVPHLSPSPLAPLAPVPKPNVLPHRLWFYVGALLLVLISMLTFFVLWWRGRSSESEADSWTGGPLTPGATAHAAALDETARLVSGVSSGLPALREALGTASRSLDRAYSKGANEPRLIREAKELAQDLAEQASGLHERLVQASKVPQEATTEPQDWLAVSNSITQLALDLALAATQPDRLEGIIKGVNQLRELANELARRGMTSARAEAPSLPYLAELSGALKGRCERLEKTLGSIEIDEQLASQLQLALVAIDRGVAQINMLSDRAKNLERTLPSEGSSR